MQAIIFIGIQATGKSTFFQNKFFDSHIRINLDMLRTRHREKLLFEACLQMKQSFVVDNTNPTKEERQRYIPPAKQYRFQIIGYYFQSKLAESIERNQSRDKAKQVPEHGIRTTHAKLQLPTFAEGFDELYYVKIMPNGEFAVDRWQNEI